MGGPAVGDQARFVQLHPIGSGIGQGSEDPPIGGDHVIQAFQRVKACWCAVLGFGQQQVGDRADEDRAQCPAGAAVFGDQGGQGVGQRGEGRLRTDFGDEVVVVGIEPFGHFQWLAFGIPAGQGEVAGRIDGAVRAGQIGKTGGQRPQCHGGVQDLVVEGEVRGDGGVGGG